VSERIVRFVAGDPSESEKYKCLNLLKANEFLNKPIGQKELRKAIKKVLRIGEAGENEEEEKKEQVLDEKKKVLIIDDDAFSSTMLKNTLKTLQLEVMQAFFLQTVPEFMY
jgi:PleD family two-component response regulator